MDNSVKENVSVFVWSWAFLPSQIIHLCLAALNFGSPSLAVKKR